MTSSASGRGNNRKLGVSLTVVTLFLGFLLSIQFRTQQTLANSLQALSSQELVSMLKSLDEKRGKLQLEAIDLRRQYRQVLVSSEEGRGTLSVMSEEIKKLQLVNGLTPVTGSGIKVTIPDNASLLHLDLVDLVNELWVSGAEAVAVNGHRLTAQKAFGTGQDEKEVFITLDGYRLFPPLVILAIGNPNTLEKGLTFTGGIIDNFNTLYRIYPVIEQSYSLVLPAAGKKPRVTYAQTRR